MSPRIYIISCCCYFSVNLIFTYLFLEEQITSLVSQYEFLFCLFLHRMVTDSDYLEACMPVFNFSQLKVVLYHILFNLKIIHYLISVKNGNHLKCPYHQNFILSDSIYHPMSICKKTRFG